MRTIAMILAGGEGTRLTVLSEERAKPAVPFAGKFRIIDFTLSNCVNSGIRRIRVRQEDLQRLVDAQQIRDALQGVTRQPRVVFLLPFEEGGARRQAEHRKLLRYRQIPSSREGNECPDASPAQVGAPKVGGSFVRCWCKSNLMAVHG